MAARLVVFSCFIRIVVTFFCVACFFGLFWFSDLLAPDEQFESETLTCPSQKVLGHDARISATFSLQFASWSPHLPSPPVTFSEDEERKMDCAILSEHLLNHLQTSTSKYLSGYNNMLVDAISGGYFQSKWFPIRSLGPLGNLPSVYLVAPYHGVRVSFLFLPSWKQRIVCVFC